MRREKEKFRRESKGSFTSFAILLVLLNVMPWAIGYADLPHYLMGRPQTPFDLGNTMIESLLILIFTVLYIGFGAAKISAMRRQWRILNDALTGIPDAVFTADEDHNLIYMNEACSRLTGYTKAEAVGKLKCYDVLRTMLCKSNCLMDQSIKTNKAIICEETVVTNRVGGEIPVDLSISVVRDKDGNLLGIVGIARDMREIKRLMQREKQLAATEAAADVDRKRAVELENVQKASLNIMGDLDRRSKDLKVAKDELEVKARELAIAHGHLEKILYSIGDVLFVIDSRALIQRVNQITTKLLGYKESELLGYPIGLVFGERNFSMERELNKRLGVVLLRMGVVAEKDIIAALAKQKENGELIGEILVGQGSLAREDLTQAILKQAQLEKLLTAGVINDNRHVLWGKTSESIPVSLNASILGKAKEKFQGAVIIAHDMREIHQLISDLEEANRSKSRFLANMSHEIRTPMAGIIGMLNLASDSVLNDEQRDCLNTAKESANALLDILNDILDISKVEAGEFDLETVDFDLRMLVEGVAKILANRASQRELEFKWSIDSKVSCSLRGDPGRLRQILMNLGSNAIKFTEEGWVIIHVELKGETDDEATVLFSVTDTGIGVPNEQQGKIFGAFVQVDGSITRRYGGTGLGLSISKQLVEMMGGQIGLESPPRNQRAVELGKGSRFWFTATFQKQPELRSAISDISAFKPQELGPGVKPGHIVEQKRHGIRILLAEDNPTNQKVMKKMIKKAGYQIKVVDNGKLAIEALEHGEYDLVLMDVRMPEMDGYEATKVIRNNEANERHIPVIALTASVMKGDRDQCLKAGMDDYISKPVNPQQLRKLIEKWAEDQDKQEEKVVSTFTPERNEADPIDLKAVLQTLDSDRKLVMDVLNEFLSNLTGQLEKLYDAIGADDAKVVENEAHGINGAAGILSANRTAAIAQRLQEIGQSGNLSGAMELLKELKGEIGCLREYVRRPDFLKSVGDNEIKT